MICGEKYASQFLKVCVDCIRSEKEQALKLTQKAFMLSREKAHLPTEPPKNRNSHERNERKNYHRTGCNGCS